MSLFKFLNEHRLRILNSTEEKIVQLAVLRPSSEELKKALPIFLDQLVGILKKSQSNVEYGDEQKILNSAGLLGKEMLRLGYTLSHVVHAYGAMCQTITQIASVTKYPVTALEFHNLNRCLDIAIAGAVTEFESVRNLETKEREVINLGSLAHELRNSLNRAIISSEMIAKGLVGVGGSTSKVLHFSLMQMNQLISRSLSEVRLRTDSGIHEEYFFIIDIISQLIVTAEVEAAAKNQSITVNVAPELELKTDRHLVFAALGNILHNAIKYSKNDCCIKIRASNMNNFAVIEIEDSGGGIPANKIENLFKPFTQEGSDRSGLGLGLTISQNAVIKCGGSIEAKNFNDGCVFTVRLPLNSSPKENKPEPIL